MTAGGDGSATACPHLSQAAPVGTAHGALGSGLLAFEGPGRAVLPGQDPAVHHSPLPAPQGCQNQKAQPEPAGLLSPTLSPPGVQWGIW